jgi:hypothetical protein
MLIGWLLDTYSSFSLERILRYEDLVAAPGRHLARFTPHARELDRQFAAFDPASRYPGVDLSPLARKLMTIRSVAERFYADFEESLSLWL